MRLISAFVTLLAVVHVSATVLPGLTPDLAPRSICPDCDAVAATDTQCKASPNYNQCACSAKNLFTIDECFACLIISAKVDDAANAIITGTNSGIGAAAAEHAKEQGELIHQQFVQDCASAGLPVTGGGSSAGSSGSPSGGSSGSSSGGSSASSSGGSSGGSAAGSSGSSSAGSSGSGGSSSSGGSAGGSSSSSSGSGMSSSARGLGPTAGFLGAAVASVIIVAAGALLTTLPL